MQIKKLLLTGLFLSSLSMKCSEDITITCSDCSDKESVLKAISKIAEKKFGRIDQFEVKIAEEADCFTIFYLNLESINDSLRKGGGGGFIKISKKDCEIIDYKMFQ